MRTIRAKVNKRLLSKAERLFTGTLQGRIIEILQNARRAGATRVEVTNEDGYVTVRDNGNGIEDFARLLDLGSSGWDQMTEVSEDPAGVGIFCLAPREVTIRSKGGMVTISGEGWTGAPVDVKDDPDPVQGTELRLQDEPWVESKVNISAVFSGLKVVVDGKTSPRLPFVSDKAVAYPELGCLIEIRPPQELTAWHHSCQRERWYGTNILVNFHGQVVTFDCHPVGEHGLHFLVDLTGEPTGIRLMLPARTQLVENEALGKLKAALELEGFRYIQRRGSHRLTYKEYLRAKELGVSLPEAEPTYTVGLMEHVENPDPVEVSMPKDLPLENCYRLDGELADRSDTDAPNAHLLAALGKFDSPFVPVNINRQYDGYSWAKLPTIQDVKVSLGKTILKRWLWSSELICVDSITITARTSDGRTFRSPVCMAVSPSPDSKPSVTEDCVYVTREAEERVSASEAWFHLGGWYEEGDTYDTQEALFTEEWDAFWTHLLGPDEQLRTRLLGCLDGKTNWKSVTVHHEGVVILRFMNGTSRKIKPPEPASKS